MSARHRTSDRTTPLRRSTWLVLALVCASASLHADVERGRALARQARKQLLDGRPQLALETLEQARVDWPGSPLVANLMADALAAADRPTDALVEYEKGMQDDYVHHALFNRAVAGHTATERMLTEAGVPADPQGLPEDAASGQMLEVIEQGIEMLDTVRHDFVSALDLQYDAPTGESIAAVNRRIADLEEMAELLRQQQEEQQDQEQQEENEDEQSQDGDDQQQDQQQDDQQDEQQDEEEQEQEQEQQQDQSSEDQESQPQDDEGGEQDEPQPASLSPEQMQRLLDQLEELEQRALQLQKAKQWREREKAERDW